MDQATTTVILSQFLPQAYVGIAAAVITTAVALASAIDASFPQPVAGSPWVPVRKVISMIAVNFGHATNAVPAGLPPADVAFAKEAASVVQAAAAPATPPSNDTKGS